MDSAIIVRTTDPRCTNLTISLYDICDEVQCEQMRLCIWERDLAWERWDLQANQIALMRVFPKAIVLTKSHFHVKRTYASIRGLVVRTITSGKARISAIVSIGNFVPSSNTLILYCFIISMQYWRHVSCILACEFCCHLHRQYFSYPLTTTRCQTNSSPLPPALSLYQYPSRIRYHLKFYVGVWSRQVYQFLTKLPGGPLGAGCSNVG